MDVQNTSTEDMDLLKKMEDEHLRLQRQVRHIQADRLQGAMGVHPQFRRQDHLLRTLKKEYLNLVKDLKIARSGAHKKKDKKMKKDLKRAILFRVNTEMDCDGGVTVMDQLDELLQRNNKHMLELRQMVAANAGQIKERAAQSEHRLISTENKLETAMKRFNSLQCENKKIREEIEHMLKDRALFNQAWVKMLNALQKGKKFLQDLFESSNLAYDQRDEWCTKLRSVQEKGKIDQMLQLQEMRDLQKAFDNEMKLFKFLAKKGVMRINKEEEERQEVFKRKEEEDVKMQCRAHRVILAEVTDYSQQNVKKTMESFVKTEQEIFSVYKLLMDVCAENEVIGRDLKRIRQHLDDRRDGIEKKEVEIEEKLERLRYLLEEKQKVTEELRRKVNDKDRLLNVTMDKIGDIFRMLNCSLEPFHQLLGDKQPSLWQMKLSLCLITEKIKEYRDTVYYCERYCQKKGDIKFASSLKKYTVHADTVRPFTAIPINLLVPADTCPACVEARWLSRVSDTFEVPFNKEMALSAIAELHADPAYVRSDRVHPITECRVPRSRVILANRYAES